MKPPQGSPKSRWERRGKTTFPNKLEGGVGQGVVWQGVVGQGVVGQGKAKSFKNEQDLSGV